MSDSEETVACTLDIGSYQQRIAWIRDLMDRALRDFRRDGARLDLTFEAAARPEVEKLIRQEKACCAFLAFALFETGPTITLTIEVPASAANNADQLLTPFLPAMPEQVCDCASRKAPR
jgi:hypothetical protein